MLLCVLHFLGPAEPTAGCRAKTIAFKYIHLVIQVLRVASLYPDHGHNYQKI